jgi:hypothetical protein
MMVLQGASSPEEPAWRWPPYAVVPFANTPACHHPRLVTPFCEMWQQVAPATAPLHASVL